MAAALPRLRCPDLAVRDNAWPPFAPLPGRPPGTLRAPPAINGARVPEAYEAIMEPKCAHGNRGFLPALRRLQSLGVRRLPHVLQAVRKGADKPHTEGDRRVPAGVDDRVKVTVT